MIILDTNSLIRFFTGDDKEKALTVKKLLVSEKKIFIPEVVFPEIEYVLKRLYNVKKEKLVEIFKFLVSRSNLKTSVAFKEAVAIFEKSSLDIADCLIVSHSFKGKLATFDKELLKIAGVKNAW